MHVFSRDEVLKIQKASYKARVDWLRLNAEIMLACYRLEPDRGVNVSVWMHEVSSRVLNVQEKLCAVEFHLYDDRFDSVIVDLECVMTACLTLSEILDAGQIGGTCHRLLDSFMESIGSMVAECHGKAFREE